MMHKEPSSIALPEGFKETLSDIPECDALLDAIGHGNAHGGLRLNPFKPCTLPWDLQTVSWEPNGRYLSAEAERPGLHPLHAAGAYYLQEPSAMLPATLLKASPGERVLDLCAAPGGKSGQIAASMKNEGLLIANEIDTKRASILVRNLERLGIQNALVLNERPDKLAERFPMSFDAILVDAPCSGEGMFRREPGSRKEWNPSLPEACARRQSAILNSAAIMLRHGGRMVYSTCTFNRVENEKVVEAFLRSHPDFGLEETRRIFPHTDPGEGHFAARLIRRGNQPVRQWPKLAQQSLGKEWQAFSRENLRMKNPPTHGAFKGDWIYAPPMDSPQLDGIKAPRIGVQIAQIKRNRVEPSHALAMTLHPDDTANAANLEMDEARRYLNGEPLPFSGEWRGWTLCFYQGLPLGWGKASDGWIKNHLPKGLRSLSS